MLVECDLPPLKFVLSGCKLKLVPDEGCETGAFVMALDVSEIDIPVPNTFDVRAVGGGTVAVIYAINVFAQSDISTPGQYPPHAAGIH